MKNKITILIISVILIVGGISVAYASGVNDKNINRPMMSTQNGGIQSNYNFDNMIKIMKDNGFNDKENAMVNTDFDTMKKWTSDMSDADYKKMIAIMQKNGYGNMANMMQSVSRENMMNTHQGMMGR